MFESKLKKIYDKNIQDNADLFIKDLSKATEINMEDPISASVKNSAHATAQYYVTHGQEAKDLYYRYHEHEMAQEYMPDGVIPNLGVDTIDIPHGYSLGEALDLIKELYIGMGTKMFGVLIRNVFGGEAFNPLHPLIAPRLKHVLDNGMHVNNKYKIMVYTNKVATPNPYELAGTRQDIVKLVIAAMSSIGTKKINTNFKIDGTNMFFDEATVNADGSAAKSGKQDQYSIVPVQIVNSGGLIYPYYGAVMLKRWAQGGNMGGRNLTPMLSANVSGWYRDDYDSEDDIDCDEWTSICTGSEPQSTDDGLQTLNHSNLGSPMLEQTWNEYCYGYANACIDTALEVYFGDYKKEHDEQEKKLKEEQEKEDGTSRHNNGARAEGERSEQDNGEPSTGTEQEENQAESSASENSETNGDGSQVVTSVGDAPFDTTVDPGVPSSEWDEWAL